ncbi:peroxidasin homolog pxn-2-like [Dreissena polymorpha]|uniref:peroxidasin homolog pxn-2-like n=1 Tax=Dreissena polymorpha TaxID=45954 RepID=UPI0022651C9B|nr:peroxidasin homolog pxn-2-like [Dreissena polymorpha]
MTKKNDPYQPRFKEGYCMEVKRSSGVNCESSGIGPSLQRQQINKLTSFIDASNVYGSSDEQLQGLRDGNTPFMRVSEGADGPRVPNGNDSTCKAKPDEGIHCSLVGDDRVNVVPSLTSYHNVFILEHNRLAERLREEFPDEEEAFQQTRKLMIAIMQKIVYDEYLPSFLSPLAMKKYKLGNLSPYKYDPSLDPTISNEFGIAYRMGHTWIPMFMAVFTKEFQPSFGRFTNETYEDPSMTYIESQNGGPSGMEGLAYWLSAKKSPATDRILEDVVRNDLFLNPTKDTSFDLAALNIQRGRDHGLPSYNEYRKFCGLSTMSSWRTRFGDLTDAALSRLEEAGYSDPDDVDLFTGALSEKPVPGGALGPTMECIIGDQFHRLKFGDRFFYKNPETGYNRDQIEAIKNYSLASLMCRNYKFERIHFPDIFRVLSPLVDCKDIDDIDLTPFLSSSLPDLPRPPESFPKPIRNIDTK